MHKMKKGNVVLFRKHTMVCNLVFSATLQTFDKQLL